jgi:hypothetical protein
MNFLEKLLNPVKKAANTLDRTDAVKAVMMTAQLPITIAEGLNRSTPWGQANQTRFNAAHSTVPPNPLTQPQPISQTHMNAVQQLVHSLAVAPTNAPQNLGFGQVNLPQGNTYNPGYTPIQNSGFGPLGHPQARAYNNLQRNQFNPQITNNQQY